MGVVLLGNTKKYREKLEKSILNNSNMFYWQEHMNDTGFKADWPIDLENFPFHLSCYYLDNNYTCAPKHDWERNRHSGIDIQVGKGTPILAPENMKICYRFTDPRDHENMSNLVAKGINSGIYYAFLHVNKKSIIRINDEYVDRGDFLCEVGDWTWKIDKENIPEDVREIFGEKYHHLHISTHLPYGAWFNADRIPGQFDPLIVFKKLF